MKRIRPSFVFAVLLITSLFSLPVFAQSDQVPNRYNPDLRHMVQFGVEPAVRLGWVHGAGETSFLRWSISGSVDRYEMDHAPVSDTDEEDTYSISWTDYTAGFDVDLLMPMRTAGRVRPYWGPGLYYRLSGASRDNEFRSDFDWGFRSTQENRDHIYQTGGVRILFGIEYALTSRISGYIESSLAIQVRYFGQDQNLISDTYDPNMDLWTYRHLILERDSIQWHAGLNHPRIGVAFKY